MYCCDAIATSSRNVAVRVTDATSGSVVLTVIRMVGKELSMFVIVMLASLDSLSDVSMALK